ncbi:Uncharacterised protein [Klebsiella pneumoniae]|nr:Uncharacterised protein [Klebsiella pneumoniae]
MLGQRPILCTTERRRLCRQRQRGLLQGAADVLHKGGPSLLVFLIQALGLLELFIDQHFAVLITDDQDLGARRYLAAILADFILLIIDGGLNYPLMLVRHIGDVLQIQVRKQMVGNWIADNRSVGLLIVNEQPQRQQRNNLFVNGAQQTQFAVGGGGEPGARRMAASFIVAKGGKTKQRQRQQTNVEQQRQKNVLHGLQQHGAHWYRPQQLHTGGADVGGDVNLHAVKGDPNMIGALFIRRGGEILRRVRLDTEAVDGHAGRDQIVNRQVEGDHRGKVSGLVEGGA